MEAERVNVSSVVFCFCFFVVGRRLLLMCGGLPWAGGVPALRYVEVRDGKLMLPTCPFPSPPHHLVFP